MKQNIVFWIGVKSNDSLINEKHGGFNYLDISKKSWQWWCKKNNIVFFEYSKSSESDTKKHRVTWTRWFDVFNLLEHYNYDKICVVDGSTIIKWNCPNFFEECPKDQLTAFPSLENVKWVYEGVSGYKEFFQNYNFDLKKYIDCGFQVFDHTHLDFLNILKDFYYNNNEKILELQSTVGRGTDQPVYNYLLQINNIEVNYNLHPSFTLNHLNRFDWLSYNWQLKEDNTPFFIKYGNIWKYSGFDRKQRYPLMKQTWDLIKQNYE